MAAYLLIAKRNFRRNIIFRDRTMQLDILDDHELMSRYRMPRAAIFSLVELLRPALERATKRSHPLSPETQVLVTLRYLAKGGFLSEIGDLHGISEASVSRSFHGTINLLCQNLDNIHFPWNPEEQRTIKHKFYDIAGFPQVIGAIDGTQVPIKRPSEDQEAAFVNRKGFHSINVQAVCDADLRFLNVVAKWPGSTHDGLILQTSGLGKRFEDHHGQDGWLLGDSGYGCKSWLLTPVLDPNQRAEERYNSCHCRTRNTVERAFGVLKSRFRCLHKSTGCLWFTPDKCAVVIMACFKLHNYCLDKHVPNAPQLQEQDQGDLPDAAGNLAAAVHQDGQAVRRKLINERFSN